MKEDSISLIAPLVSKLIEWSHFIEKADGYETYFTLYDYRKYYPQNDLEIIILHSLSLFLQQIYNSEYVYIINDFFPKNINISIEQLNIGNHSCSLIDLPKQNDKSIKNFNIVILEGIVIKDNLLSLKYSYSILDYSKEKSHILSTKKLSYDFSYNYSEYDQVWQFVNMTKINE